MERAKVKPSLILLDGTVKVYDMVEEFEHGFLVYKNGYFGFCKPTGEVLLELKYRKKIIPCGHTLLIPSYTGHYDSLDLRINYLTKDAYDSVTEDEHYIYAHNDGKIVRFLRSNGALIIDSWVHKSEPHKGFAFVYIIFVVYKIAILCL